MGVDRFLERVVYFICDHYPKPADLSKARVTKLVYLSDWRSAIIRKRQLTSISWKFNHYGPYVEDVVSTARQSSILEVVPSTNAYGAAMELIQALPDAIEPELLSEQDQRFILGVIDATHSKNWTEFLKLVYSTYPVATQERYSKLDLVALADEYTSDDALQTVRLYLGDTHIRDHVHRDLVATIMGLGEIGTDIWAEYPRDIDNLRVVDIDKFDASRLAAENLKDARLVSDNVYNCEFEFALSVTFDGNMDKTEWWSLPDEASIQYWGEINERYVAVSLTEDLVVRVACLLDLDENIVENVIVTELL